MTPTFDVDNFVVQMTPIQYRITNTLLFVRSMNSQLAWLQGLFNDLQNGSSCDFYDPALPYAKGNRAKSYFGVYESLVDSNLGNDLNDTAYWLKVLDSYIGSNELCQYSSNKIVFEYALNRIFGLTFRQYANASYTPLSDIYISTDAPAFTSFMMSAYPLNPLSYMYPTYSTGIMYDPPVYTAASTYLFTIHVPAAFYASLGVDAEKIIRAFADRIAMAGTQYSIQTY